jgi:hypothetical protein
MTALQQIIKEAKIIKKKYPNKKWMDCVKQASAIYKSKHKTVKKKAVKKVVRKKAIKKVGSSKRISAVKKTVLKKPISESRVLHEIDKVKHDIKTLESMQKQHMMKKHKSSIGATIRKKHSEIKKLLKKY